MLRKRKVVICNALLAAGLGIAPLYIQITMNATNHKVVSFMPVINLGENQIEWGISNINYATWMGGGAPQKFYPSKALINASSNKDKDKISWYFKNPVASIKLLTCKLIGAFDFDYLVAYPYHPLTYKWLFSFFSFAILWIGTFGILVHLLTNKLTLLGSRFMPCIIFLAWCSISLLSALELRFTLPLISYFIIVGCTTINFIIRDKNKKVLMIMLLILAVFMPLSYHVAKFVRLQSVVQH